MVQSVDSFLNRPVYNAVNIRIRKPEVNAGKNNDMTVVTDNGIYNAVKINIENPSVNTDSKKSNCPECLFSPAGYGILNQIPLPQGYPVASAYYETSLILPNRGEEFQIKEEDKPQVQSEIVEEEKGAEVPPPNYTTTEAEKGIGLVNDDKTEDVEQNTQSEVQFKASSAENKKPEIVPSEPIKPDVDISLVKANLENTDYDVQAQQMEEIARVSLENPQKAIPYIVKDVFTELIEITKKDTTKLAPPSEKQIEIRKKIIENIISAEIAKEQNKPVKLPHQIPEEEMKLASEISPMEQAERNKEYAIYTLSILSKVYIDEIQKETGNVVPFTDVPGIADIVNELRYNPNPAVKVAAIDGLRHIQRPEYKNEINAIFSIAKSDKNPEVSAVATKSIEKISKN
ncbi:hypothetical protein IKQ21_05285 [bacterium]|nr:hypothetical protein [bacterium]